MSLDTEKAITIVENYIKEAESLIDLPHNTGSEKKELLDIKIKNLLQRLDKERIREYNDLVTYYGILPSTNEGWQDFYVNRVKKMKNFLVALKEDFELKRDVSTKSSKLDKIENEIKELEAEAIRRKMVVETKGWGAIIEIIQMLRDELKNRKDIQTDISEIKKDIKEIKNILEEHRISRD